MSVGSEGGEEQYPQDSDEYQLVYRDEDYYSDYNLDHLSDDYLDYLYQIYDDLDNEITYYDDDLYDDNDAAAAVIGLKSCRAANYDGSLWMNLLCLILGDGSR